MPDRSVYAPTDAPPPLFNQPPIARSTDPATSHDAAAEVTRSGRRSKQADAILAALREGPKTSQELAAIALKYTSRVSDLRQSGHQIRATPLAGGSHLYRLTQEAAL